MRPILALHRLTNSHSHARASAPRAAQTHEFTLSHARVSDPRAAQTHEFTLSRSCARPAFRSFTHSLCHARVPDSRCADSRMHFVTLARPACLGLSPTDSRTHVLTFSRWRARAAWIQDYSSIQGFTFPVSYVWPSQIHREPAFLVSSRGEPASLLDFMACMVALSVLCCQRNFSYVRLWISLSWQAISCVLCQRTLRVAPRCLWTSSQPKMTEGSWGSWLLRCHSVASARAFLRTAVGRAQPWQGLQHRARLVACWRCWHCFGRVSQGLRQALLSQC